MKRTVGQHHGDLRAALITAALELISDGEPSPSLRKVARRAGVSPGAPYHHFENHDALIAAVATQGFSTLYEVLADVRRDDPAATLRELTREYVLFCFEHRAQYRTMFSSPLQNPSAELEASARETFGLLVQGIMRAATTNDLEAIMRWSRQAWALIHGAVMLGLDGMFKELNGPADPEGIADEVSDTIVRLVCGPT